MHCQSKDDDLGIHNLDNRGDEYKWNFKENTWRTTIFWCKFEKSSAYISFNSFWPELRRIDGFMKGTGIELKEQINLFIRIYLFNFREALSIHLAVELSITTMKNNKVLLDNP